MQKTFSTPDLCDTHPGQVRVMEPLFKSYGQKPRFYGEVVTVKCLEDNSRVKELAETDGHGKVMVVDGGGSLRKALLGDLIAAKAVENGWEGFVIFGCVRDVDMLAHMVIGVKALNSIPLKTERKGEGEVNIPISFAGQNIQPGQYIYSDETGIILSPVDLLSND